IETGDRRSTRARARELHVADVLADERQAVEHSRGGNDRSAVLVIVEDRNFHALPQCALDVEALWSLDVLKVDPAEGWLEACNNLHEFVRIALVDLNVEHVDA